MTSFGRPTIGPRAYLSLGPSNWFETFPRREADQALLTLLGPIPVSLVVESLLRQQKLAKTPIDWADLLEELEKLVKRPSDTFEPRAVVALWAACIIEHEKVKP